MTMQMGTNIQFFNCTEGMGGAGCPVDIRLAPTGVERRPGIPIKLQNRKNLEEVFV